MNKLKIILLIAGLFTTLIGVMAQGDDVTEMKWPREVTTKDGVLTYYQPQIDSYKDNIVEGRSAISLQPENGEMLFGAFWFKSFLQTDKAARTAVLDQIEIMDLQFPGLTDSEEIADKSEKIASTLERMDIVISLDRLIASLDEAEGRKKLGDNVNNAPPNIYYRDRPAILVSVDGEPIWKELKDQNLKFVENSPFFISQDLRTNQLYINGDGKWFTTKTPPDNWTVTTNVPSNIKSFAEANAPDTENTETTKADKNITPELVVVYEPSELIVTDGAPDYKTIKNTDLLFVTNTEDDIIMDIKTQMHYVLIAGRWYKSKTLADGSWEFEEPINLPVDFANIPADGDMANVRVSVPNTDEAKDALLEQTIPQTAQVLRSEAKLEVEFDGEPKFKRIPNTDVSYSVNSDKSVMKINQHYYSVDNGIWFISNYPDGPWEVSDHRPDEVDQIPPSEPVYNTKYVYVYNSTPEYVYVGYLPGYTHSYVYNGVVVYGTGYHYPYWYGSVYYPRPVTYGYSVHYNPFTGWGFHLGYYYGWVGWRYHPYYRPYWGPCGYRAGYRNGYYDGYQHGYHNGYKHGVADSYRPGSQNAYLNQRSGVRQTTTRDQIVRTADISRPSSRPNNMYSDRSGNVYERTAQGEWKERSNITRKAAPATREVGNTKRTAVERNAQSQERQTRETTTPQTRKTAPQTRENTRDKTQPQTQPQTRSKESQPRVKEQQRTPVREQRNVQPQQQPQPQTRPAERSTPPGNLNNSYQNRERGQQNYNRSRNATPPAAQPTPPSRSKTPAKSNTGSRERSR